MRSAPRIAGGGGAAGAEDLAGADGGDQAWWWCGNMGILDFRNGSIWKWKAVGQREGPVWGFEELEGAECKSCAGSERKRARAVKYLEVCDLCGEVLGECYDANLRV